MKLFGRLKELAAQLKTETATLYLAARDPRTPWYAKAVIACVVAYALSPIDLIPDFIPVLGYLDDLLLLPLGIYLALKLIPPIVLADARRIASETGGNLARNRMAAIVIIILWIATVIVVVTYLVSRFNAETETLIGA